MHNQLFYVLALCFTAVLTIKLWPIVDIPSYHFILHLPPLFSCILMSPTMCALDTYSAVLMQEVLQTTNAYGGKSWGYEAGQNTSSISCNIVLVWPTFSCSWCIMV